MTEKLIKNLIPVAIIIAGVLIAGAVVYVNKTQKCPSETASSDSEIISLQEAGERVINFINQDILGGKTTASLNEILKENGLYKIKFTIEGQKIESYVTLDGKFLFPKEAAIDLSKTQTIGDFSVTDDEVCKENGKPIIYFFGSEGCAYCSWEHPIIEEVAGKFGNQISFHNNMDSQDDMDVFQKYSTGGIPTLVLGCKYYRVGAGSQAGEEGETENLTALICKLTDNRPANVCNPVQDLINQIED